MVQGKQSSQSGSYTCGGASVQKRRKRAVKDGWGGTRSAEYHGANDTKLLLRRELLGVAGLRERGRLPPVTPHEARRRSAAYRRFAARRTDNRGMRELEFAYIQAISWRHALTVTRHFTCFP